MTFPQWQATRKWADDLSTAVDADLDGASGFHYCNGHIEARAWGFGVVIGSTNEEFETLEAAERYLWGAWAQSETSNESPAPVVVKLSARVFDILKTHKVIYHTPAGWIMPRGDGVQTVVVSD